MIGYVMRLSAKLALALALGLGVASAASAGIVNGTFEAGNVNGWSTHTSNSDDADYGAHGSVATVPSGTVGAPASTQSHVAFMHAGRIDDYQLLWQDFNVVSPGATLSVLLKWNGKDSIYYDASYDDKAYARIARLDAGNNPITWTTIWDASIGEYGNVDGPSGGDSPWETAFYNFTQAGSYRIEFGIANFGIGAVGDDDDAYSSELYFDNVALVDQVPEPGALGIVSLGVASVALRRRKVSAA